MDFTHDDEQLALRDAVRGLVAKAYGDYEDRRRTVAQAPGFDEQLWRKLAEMGVLGLPFDETDGGVGAGPIEVGLVAEELGRALAPEPFLTSVVLAGGLVAAAGSAEQRSEVLGALAAGESILAFAHLEAGGRWAATAQSVRATESGARWTIDGSKEPVLHGARADLLVVSAAVGDETRLFLVDPAADGVERRDYPTLDGSRAARIVFAGAPATPLGDGDASATIAAVLDQTRIIAGNQAVGALDAALRLTSAYLTSRKQFGVTLNTFQALTFKAADMYIALELTRSLVAWATMVLAEAPEDAGEAATRASLQVSRASRLIGQAAIQLHGGIGMTAEYAVGGYVATLTSLEQLSGTGDHHLAALVATIGDHAEVDPLR